MRPTARHLIPETRPERALTQLAAVASIAALGAYLWWRATATIDGTSLGLALALLSVEAWFGLRHLLVVLPALMLRIGGRAEEPNLVPEADVLAVIGDEPLRAVRVCLKSCLEVRGRRGFAAINTMGRDDVADLCRRLGVAVVDPERMPDLGTEAGRVADLLVLVPASSWVSADVAVMAAPAFAGDDTPVGAVSLANTTHELVWLPGTRGYLAPIFGDERLAARLDTVGLSGLPDGPVVFAKEALRSVGGVRWAAEDPLLASHVAVTAHGWRTRAINAPGSYRMASAREAAALLDRSRRTAAWVDARRRLGGERSSVAEDVRRAGPSRPWRGFVTLSALVERWSVVPRIVVLAIPIAALLTERLPAQVDPVDLLVFGGLWAGIGTVARRRALGRRQAGVENARIGFRSLGADLTALAGGSPRRRHHVAVQNLVMAVLLVGMLASVWQTLGGVFSRPDGFEHFLMVASLLAIPALIRDSAVAYRQQRLLPRTRFDTVGRGSVVGLSPEGLDVRGTFPIGSTHAVDLELPLTGERVVRRSVAATVMAHRRVGENTESHLRLYPDDDLAIELAYFCGVTAPTMRWHGIEPLVARPIGDDDLGIQSGVPAATRR